MDIEYGSGGIKGIVDDDVCKIGDITAAKQGLGAVYSTSGPTFLVSQMDGIVGFGYETIAVDKLPTFMNNANTKDKSFAFYLKNKDEGDSFMTIPGKMDTGYTLVKTHNVVEKTYWNLNLTSMQQGTKTPIKQAGLMGAIDSGTSLIVGGKDVIDPLVAGITVEQDCSNISTLPNITFTFDTTPYVLTANDYVVKVTQMGQTQCLMGIMSTAVPEGFHYVIVGDVFFRKFNPYFNGNDNTVSFYTEDAKTKTKAAEFLQ